jgi:glycosyltransferase involved in cell wall biosynthesis
MSSSATQTTACREIVSEQLTHSLAHSSGAVPLVSVIIPSYNYGRFVTQAVDGALAQTYPNLEVIVVDDGSTDDTRQRLEPYGDRIRYIYQDNRGLSAARNTGIRHAGGEWIALLDADDLWHPQKIETQLAAIRRLDQIGLMGSPPAEQMPEHLPPEPPMQRLGVRDFLLVSRFGPSSALVRRDCFDKVGYFDERLRSVEDRDMWLRLAVQFPAVVVESPCWTYRIHADQMSHAAWRMYENYRLVLEGFFENYPEYRGLRNLGLAYLNLDASLCFLDAGERLRSFVFLMRSFGRRPWPMRLARRPRWLRLKLLLRLMVGEGAFHKLKRTLSLRSYSDTRRPATQRCRAAGDEPTPRSSSMHV